uniref:Golgin subfamily A member 6-like protein 22 n=1 Tax=Macrostomum lignano TaxID=282301 RepID=A0A1I8FIP2_9PLAT
MYNFKQNFGSRSKDDSRGQQQQQQQLVPIRAESLDDHRSMSSPSDNDERIRSLETRLRVAAEKSNRALLEESELKVVSRKARTRGDERRARQMLEGAVKSSGDLVNQLAQRAADSGDYLFNALPQRANPQEDRLAEEVAGWTTWPRPGPARKLSRLACRVPAHMDAWPPGARAGGAPSRPGRAPSARRPRLLEEMRKPAGSIRAEAEERRRLEQRLDERLTEALKTAGTEQHPGWGHRPAALQMTNPADRAFRGGGGEEAALSAISLEKGVRPAHAEDAARSQAEAERSHLARAGGPPDDQDESKRQTSRKQCWEALGGALAQARQERPELRAAQRAGLAEAGLRRPRRSRSCRQAMRERSSQIETPKAARAAKMSRACAAADCQSPGAGGPTVQQLECSSKNQWESLLEDYRRETGRRIAGMEEQLQAVKSRLDRK